MLRLTALALILIAAALALSCGQGASPQASPASSPLPPAKVTFMAGFRPQANLPFVGVYVAQERGFFAQQGLEVEVQHAAQSGEHIQLLTVGRVQFSTADAANVLQRIADPGLPLVAIALIGQRGQQAFAALADKGINTPRDWEGHKVGYKGKPTPDTFAIMKASGVNQDRVSLINVGFDPRVLLEGLVDVYPLFKSNEVYTLERKLGAKLRLWDAADYGVPTLGLAYITTRDYMQREPSVVERFLKAALQGIYYAQEHPQEAVEAVLKYAPEADREHQRFMLEAELKDAVTPLTAQNGLGWMTEEQWRSLQDMLLQHEGLSKPVDLRQAFDDGFLKRIYEGGKLRWP